MIPLQSGSNGNCTYVEAGEVRLLLDAGISGRQAEARLARFGRDIREVDAVVISHDHADHSQSLGVFHRKFGLPIYVTEPTYRAAARRCRLGTVGDLRHFRAGETLRFDGVALQTVATPHDGADGVVFVVDDGRRRLGVLTDLGHVFAGLDELVGTLDAVLLESNYDPRMLEEGDYPEFLKARIRGSGGHLSNEESAHLVARWARRLAWVCLGHLSEDNNRPRLALATHRRIAGRRAPLHVASRHEAVGPLEV